MREVDLNEVFRPPTAAGNRDCALRRLTRAAYSVAVPRRARHVARRLINFRNTSVVLKAELRREKPNAGPWTLCRGLGTRTHPLRPKPQTRERANERNQIMTGLTTTMRSRRSRRTRQRLDREDIHEIS